MKNISGNAEVERPDFQNPAMGARRIHHEDKHAARRVIVSSNCQTGGIAAALQVIFPDNEIVPLPLPAFANAAAESQALEFRNTDVWITVGRHELLEKHGVANQIQLVKIPIIKFSGFHPDLVYARKLSTNELIAPHYNSAIAVWAYKNNLAISDAAKLFNARTFAELSYLDRWGPSIKQLKQEFGDSDLAFSEFILPMRREGLFMHSVNHPRVMALVRLAKLAAQKIGAGADVLDKYIDINDGLNDVIWPVYPDIAENLSLHSAYEWKLGEGRWICGVPAYLEYAYENYARQGVAPHDIIAVQANEPPYDQVLGMQTGIKS